MKSHFLFRLKPTFTLEEANSELRALGGEEIYSIEDFESNSFTLGAFFPLAPQHLTSLEILLENAPQEIDWEAEWRQNTHLDSDGHLTLSLEEFKPGTPPIKLLPGAGFGDLTHPTTQMMLRLLGSSAERREILDVGCGSGILSIAAMQMGAKEAFALDIDEQSLLHTKKNCVLNQFENSILISKNFENKTFSLQSLILMNMILAEQIQAWNSLPSLHHQSLEILTSGILKSQRMNYLRLTKNWNWKLIQEIEEEQWMSFRFTTQK